MKREFSTKAWLLIALEPGDDPVPRRSAVNRDSIESVSVRSSSSAWDGWPRPGCARSALPPRSRSTVREVAERRPGPARSWVQDAGSAGLVSPGLAAEDVGPGDFDRELLVPGAVVDRQVPDGDALGTAGHARQQLHPRTPH